MYFTHIKRLDVSLVSVSDKSLFYRTLSPVRRKEHMKDEAKERVKVEIGSHKGRS